MSTNGVLGQFNSASRPGRAAGLLITWADARFDHDRDLAVSVQHDPRLDGEELRAAVGAVHRSPLTEARSWAGSARPRYDAARRN
jgi:hypothetical protein